MPFIKHTNTWLTLSAVLLVSIAILGVAVHASTVSTDKHSRESCSSAAHKQFHTDAKMAMQEWWDQASPKDEKGHQKLLKSLNKQHKDFHKAMRDKKPCPSFPLHLSDSARKSALQSSRSGSALSPEESPSKRAAPGPSPAAPSPSLPFPSANGSPSPSVPSPGTTISSSTRSSSGTLTSSSMRSSSSGAVTGSSQRPAAEITPGNTTLSVYRLFVGQFDNTKYSVLTTDPDGIRTSCLTSIYDSVATLLPADFPLKRRVEDCAGHFADVTAEMPPIPVVERPGNATLTVNRLPISGDTTKYSWSVADPDRLLSALVLTAGGAEIWTGSVTYIANPPCSASAYTHFADYSRSLSPSDFPLKAIVTDCAGNASEVTAEMPPLP